MHFFWKQKRFFQAYLHSPRISQYKLQFNYSNSSLCARTREKEWDGCCIHSHLQDRAAAAGPGQSVTVAWSAQPRPRGHQHWAHVQGLGMHGKQGIWELPGLLAADVGAPAAEDTLCSQHRHCREFCAAQGAPHRFPHLQAGLARQDFRSHKEIVPQQSWHCQGNYDV